ncbi:MAG: C10 family peptidase [Muribaculaceae bacterium]|nr:C10 family peptidase [Muribaculaceae bacterium]
MRKNILSALCLFGIAAVAVAAPITPEQALGRLGSTRHKVAGQSQSRLVHTAYTSSGNPSVYVFNFDTRDGGFMVLSADDSAYPLLGYTDSGAFDSSDMAPGLRYWLEEYGRQIEYASANASKPVSSESLRLAASREGRQAIEPMIKTSWDQISPFNDQCPLHGAAPTYTGCVATSMAQVMNYWQYPEVGEGSVTYTASTLQKRLSMDFSKQAFDWDNMADVYIPGRYTEAQASAVAYLMKACGYAVRMDYSSSSSGALAMNIRRAMVNNFKYDASCFYTLRWYHSATEWEQLMYNSLAAGCPVMVGGSSSTGGGHSFICDGYDDNGYFHFNWGWTGMSNGYFLLDALTPDALGSGGGTGGGFTFTQDALFNLRPYTGEPVEEQPLALTQLGALKGEVTASGLKLTLEDMAPSMCMWVNYNPSTITCTLGAEVLASGADISTAKYSSVYSTALRFQGGEGYYSSRINTVLDLDALNLADGTYEVRIVTHSNGAPEGEWVRTLCRYGFSDCVTITKSGSTYSVKNIETPRLYISDAKVIGGFYYNCPAEIEVVVENPSDMELSGGVAPVLYNNNSLRYMGESIMVTVPAKGSVTRRWTTSMYDMNAISTPSTPQMCTLSFYNEDINYVYSEDIWNTVYMNPTPARPTVTAAALPKVLDATLETVRVGMYMTDIYTITNPLEIKIVGNFKLTSGWYRYNSWAGLGVVEGQQVAIMSQGEGKLSLPEEGAQSEFTVTLQYADMQPDTDYEVIVGYIYNNAIEPIYGARPVKLRLSLSGVEDVAVSSDALRISWDKTSGTATAVSPAGVVSLEAYDIAGSIIGASASDTLVLGEGSGMTVITARDADGRTATVKVLR